MLAFNLLLLLFLLKEKIIFLNKNKIQRNNLIIIELNHNDCVGFVSCCCCCCEIKIINKIICCNFKIFKI
jgi:hypothetical protein